MPTRAWRRAPSGRSMPPTSARMPIAACTARSAASSKALRETEISEHAVAHEFRNEAAEPTDGAGGGILVAPDQAAKQFWIDHADSAVEPTMSQNSTVT